jgi:hypothetical protein
MCFPPSCQHIVSKLIDVFVYPLEYLWSLISSLLYLLMSFRVTPIKGLGNLIWETSNHLLSSFLKIQASLPNSSSN